MLYFIEVCNPEEYWTFNDQDGWDAWYVWRRQWKDIWYQIRHGHIWFYFSTTDRPRPWFSIHYLWYDGPHYSIWFWRFNICM